MQKNPSQTVYFRSQNKQMGKSNKVNDVSKYFYELTARDLKNVNSHFYREIALKKNRLKF